MFKVQKFSGLALRTSRNILFLQCGIQSVSVASLRLGLGWSGAVPDGVMDCGQGTSELTISHKNIQDLTRMRHEFS